MEQLISSKDALLLDELSIKDGMIDSLCLMENAALSIFNNIKSKLNLYKNVVFIAGGGGNGGDAIAAARIAYSNGYNNVSIYLVDGNENSDRKKQRIIAENYGVKFTSDFSAADLIIDGYIGVGFKGQLRDNAISLIEKINSLDAVKISIDVPSGLNEESNTCVSATETITMGRKKLFMYSVKNREKCGKITLVNPSFSPKAFSRLTPRAELYNPDEYNKLCLSSSSYKNTKSHIAIFASSHDYLGAALITANTAFKVGVGLVTLFSTKEVLSKIVNEKPSLILREYSLDLDLSNYDAILFGPGFDKNQTELLEYIVASYSGPLVLDAEGINTYKKCNFKTRSVSPLVVTPHLGELKNFFTFTNSDEYFSLLSKTAKDENICIVSKCDVVSIAEDDTLKLVDGSNPYLGIAGSGDVLSSIITCFLAQKRSVLDAVLLHQKAGRVAHEEYNYFTIEELITTLGTISWC